MTDHTKLASPNIPVTVLCCRTESVYKQVEGIECYDAHRDAMTWPGGTPVIAHPPCRVFGRLRTFAKPENERAEVALGLHCLDMVDRWGGVLEQPACSTLLRDVDKRPGWILALPQWWFGHRADKASWFYVHGLSPKDVPEIPLRLGDAPWKVERMGRREREETPRDLALWLVDLARRVRA